MVTWLSGARCRQRSGRTTGRAPGRPPSLTTWRSLGELGVDPVERGRRVHFREHRIVGAVQGPPARDAEELSRRSRLDEEGTAAVAVARALERVRAVAVPGTDLVG